MKYFLLALILTFTIYLPIVSDGIVISADHGTIPCATPYPAPPVTKGAQNASQGC